MGSLGDELSLDLRPSFVPRTISDFLKEVSTIGNVSDKASKLEDFVKQLEEEMRKIDAFKRELPLCMLLLNDAILVLKEEGKKCSARNIRPVLEEFIPLKKRNRDADEDNEEEEEEEEEGHSTQSLKRDNEIRDKKNWMSSVQLWNADDFPSDTGNQRFSDPKITNRFEPERNEENHKNRSGSMAFLPFRGYGDFPARNDKEGKEEISSAQGLSLLIPSMRNAKEESDSGLGLVSTSRISGGRGIFASAASPNTNFRSLPRPPPPLPQHQCARKQRRCWSPDLHRRFVNSLQQLGGSQVATPKQIRELMQVEGLTNDEVKSHLQKYRLHTRKHQTGNSNSNASPEKQSVVVLGGNLWNSQENSGGESSKGSSSQSGSPQGPLQLAATTTTGGDSMEDDEDAKSESFSWKGHHNPKPLKDQL